MRIKKTLLELRTKGFKPLKEENIHCRCPNCGRKYSNSIRAEWDVKEAFLIEILCPKCSMGCKDPEGTYFTADGREILYDFDYDLEKGHTYEIMGYRETKE